MRSADCQWAWDVSADVLKDYALNAWELGDGLGEGEHVLPVGGGAPKADDSALGFDV